MNLFLASHSRMTQGPCLESNCLIQGNFVCWRIPLTKLCIDGKLQAIYKLIESMNGQIQMAMANHRTILKPSKTPMAIGGSGSIWVKFSFPECTIHLTKHPLISVLGISMTVHRDPRVVHVHHAGGESMVRKKNFSNLMKWGRLGKLNPGDCLKLSGRV